MNDQPTLFHLQRDHDVSGVSGTGRVADGVQWPDGTATLRWISDRPSTVHWDRLDDAEAIHGHGGATRIVWADAAATLSQTERNMLRYALDLAQEQMFSRGDEFTDDDQAAVDSLRRMADEPQQDGAQS